MLANDNVFEVSKPLKSIDNTFDKFINIYAQVLEACTVPIKLTDVISNECAYHGHEDAPDAEVIGIVKSEPVPIISSPSLVILHHGPLAMSELYIAYSLCDIVSFSGVTVLPVPSGIVFQECHDIPETDGVGSSYSPSVTEELTPSPETTA